MVGVKLGIDFGSANITVFAEHRGIVLSEPSVLILDSYTNETIAMGKRAKDMLGKLPASMKAVFPITDGIVGDYSAACFMLGRYLDRICAGRLLRPSVLMCVPGSVTDTGKKAVFDVMMAAGAGRACFVNEALAAAIGAGVSLTEPKGVCVCDIGGGITDCAVVTMGNIALSNTVRVGGNLLTDLIIEYVHHEYNVELGRASAENIKHTVGSAVMREVDISVFECGKNCETGIPQTFEISSHEVCRIFAPYLNDILDCIKHVIEETTPELCADILDNGIILTGGTAKLYGIDRFIENATGIKTVCAADNENCAVLGLGKLLKNMKYLERNGYIFSSSDNDDMEDNNE